MGKRKCLGQKLSRYKKGCRGAQKRNFEKGILLHVVKAGSDWMGLFIRFKKHETLYQNYTDAKREFIFLPVKNDKVFSDYLVCS